MKKIFLISLAILVALSFIRAADQPVVEQKSKSGTEQPVVELKNKSAFALENGTRSPFWPIGWKPTARVSNNSTEHAGGDVPASAFVVTTITLDTGAHFAIINGKAMLEGQQFGLQLGTQTYQITVKRIEDGRVILGRRDQEIVVPLRRK
jgi:hypothetical protein